MKKVKSIKENEAIVTPKQAQDLFKTIKSEKT